MIPQLIVLECPSCGAPARLRSLASGNTLGAVLWSDGRLDAPMLPEVSAIGRCPNCDGLYWVEDARELANTVGFDVEAVARWKDAPELLDLDESGYFEALDAGFGSTPEREYFLRLAAWRRGNDRFRTAERPEEPWALSDRQAENLNDLAEMFDDEVYEEQFLKAEAYRQLGRFEDALRALDAIGVDWILKRRDFYRRLCEAKSASVVRVDGSQPK